MLMSTINVYLVVQSRMYSFYKQQLLQTAVSTVSTNSNNGPDYVFDVLGSGKLIEGKY